MAGTPSSDSSSSHETGCQSADAAGYLPLKDGVARRLAQLVISPNLEALLEHDERVRSPPASPACASPALQPVILSGEPTPSIGLPPPPRKRRSQPSTAGPPVASAQDTVHSETRGEGDASSSKASPRPTPAKDRVSLVLAALDTSVSLDNPYLNPAPGPSLQPTASRSSASLPSSGSHYTADASDESYDSTRHHSPLSPSKRAFSHNTLLGIRRRVSLPPGPRSLLAHYDNESSSSSDRGPSTLERILGRAPQTPKSTREQTQDNRPFTAEKSDVRKSAKKPKLSYEERLLQAGILPPPPKISSRKKEKMASVGGDHNDARVRQFAENAGSASAHPRVSHAYRSSDASHSSESSHIPASSMTHSRISISSTQYPSSMDSHRHGRAQRSRPTLPSASTKVGDRESFIDLGSPSTPRRPSIDTSSIHSGETSPAMPTFVVHNSPSPMSSKSSLDSDPSVARRPRLSARSPTSQSFTISASPPRSSKPPIPTAPKPKFRRSISAQPSGAKRLAKSSSSSEASDSRKVEPLPPTTNLLNPQERAELIRKTRKLTQVFGKTPAASAVYPESPILGLAPQSIPQARRGHHRGAASMVSDAPHTRAIWPPPETTQYLSPNGRRFSTPLSPDQLSFLSVDMDERRSVPSRSDHYIEVGTEEGEAQSGYEEETAPGPPDSPTSFIDLSDEEATDDIMSFIDVDTPKSPRRMRPSPSEPSLVESLSPEEQSEEERRRKRERLAKLHRFLGSRVPVGLVLGVEDPAMSLPPPALETVHSEGEDQPIRVWARRRRSSSAAAFPAHWSDDVDRLKEDLDEREKAIIVRRAQKMEKMFGAQPPQSLYHTRKPSTMVNTDLARTGHSSSSTPTSAHSPTGRNMNQSAYVKKGKGKSKKSNRPGTSESAKGLLKPESVDYTPEDQSVDHRLSAVYMHYRHSLNSLTDIIDREDKESLAQLHQYLNGEEEPFVTFTRDPQPSERKMSNASSLRSERRRSLPPRTSMVSLASEYNIGSPDAEMTSFQLRRRKAAKLTSFFGVDYRDLISDVLESIEKEVQEDGGKGTLKPDEVQDLLTKLRRLRTKRDVIS